MATVPAPLPTLDQVVGWIESRNDCNALRFEPLVFNRRLMDAAILSNIMSANKCTHETARMIYSCSYGRFQVMGFNLYSTRINYNGEIGHYFSDAILQRKMFYDFLVERSIDYTVLDLIGSPAKRIRFAQVYNGSVSYADNIVAAFNHYGVSIQ